MRHDRRGLQGAAALLVVALCACGARSTGGGGGGGDGGPDVFADTPVGKDGPTSTDQPVAPDTPVTTDVPSTCAPTQNADLLFVVDNSNSMAQNQAYFARHFDAILNSLTAPTVGSAINSLHIGVISTDLGTPGSVVPSCANSDQGDDGVLNPIRNGRAIAMHQPWTTAPPGYRPSMCMNDPNQFPNFLTFDAMTTNAAMFRDQFVCNAYLSTGGCGLEQQIESAYRALIVHNPRAVPGNTDPNAGFVRDNAVLGILFVTDEEDGSVRDCRYAESGVSCTDAVTVFDIMSRDWASADLNLRFYMYVPGSRQDPTWSLDRYMDPTRLTRGFLSLKPGRPQLVVMGAITGVPLDLPMRGDRVDWDTLLGTLPDGSNGYTRMSAEGPVSMRQRNMDPTCSTRVVPACRREGSTQTGFCDPASQYFAWPSRRVAQLVRRFDERFNNGLITSICRNDYSGMLTAFADKLRARATCAP